MGELMSAQTRGGYEHFFTIPRGGPRDGSRGGSRMAIEVRQVGLTQIDLRPLNFNLNSCTSLYITYSTHPVCTFSIMCTHASNADISA